MARSCLCVCFTGSSPLKAMLVQLFIFLSTFAISVFGLEPSFDVPVINVTIQEKDTAVLPCSVDFLGEHKVVWTDQWSTLLTLDDRRIIDDPRISIERPYTRDWNLHIRKVTYSDRGQYTCQINTNPVKTKSVMLIVLVPSKIINELSSRDKTSREGETVTLVCNVTGVPTPEVTWYKLPNEGLQAKERLDLDPGSYTFIDSCAYTLKQTGIGTAGEVLIIHNISRYCDGSYECVAYNNVDPAVTRQIKVFVEFAPEVSLPNKRIGQYPGMETILDCEIMAHPHGVMWWMRKGKAIDQMHKDKYDVELYSGNEDSKRKTLSLRVKNINEEDFGEYTCYASNTIGQDSELMILYDYTIKTKTKTTIEVSTFYPINPVKDPFENGRTLNPGVIFPPKTDVILTGRPTSGLGNGHNPNQAYMPGEAALGSGAVTKLPHMTSVLHTLSLITSYYVLQRLML